MRKLALIPVLALAIASCEAPTRPSAGATEFTPSFDTPPDEEEAPDYIPPDVLNAVAEPSPVAVNEPVTLSALIDDTNTGGSIVAAANYSYRIDDGSISDRMAMGARDGAFDETAEEVFATTSFSAPGLVVFCVEGIDGTLNVTERCLIPVSVYDPVGGFVTGSGLIKSPAGAYKPDPNVVGMAQFAFVSRYTSGITEFTGNAQFRFRAGDLDFHSTVYDWLVVTGSDYARFKGSGTINGMGGDYRFMVWAGDNSPDTFRIRIWEEDEGTGVETVRYDNGSEQAIAAGQIIVHTN